VSNFLDDHTQTFAIGLAAVVSVAALAVALWRPSAHPSESGSLRQTRRTSS
jgi:hypothetical protein